MMLQQTQVDRVIEKYQQWMKRFPDVTALARTKSATVIAQWQGLGYNRRALYLQRTAQTIVRDFHGAFPETTAELLSLPGIGPYTARAIMSFAYGAHEPIVDTNVRRVVGRIFLGYKQLLHMPEERAWSLAAALLPRDKRSYYFNQALMDFGAMICTARKPQCNTCPMRSLCVSYPKILQAKPDQLRVKKPVSEKQYFGQPRRIWRGKILAHLHNVGTVRGATVREIGNAIQSDFAVERMPWLREVIDTLVRDGLLRVEGEHIYRSKL
jgi:A/G-specific adenine glycosylase